MVNYPVETIIVSRINNEATQTGTMVIKIPATTAEHNMIVELLKRLRKDYPGAWYSVLQELQQERRAAQEGEVKRKTIKASEVEHAAD